MYPEERRANSVSVKVCVAGLGRLERKQDFSLHSSSISAGQNTFRGNKTNSVGVGRVSIVINACVCVSRSIKIYKPIGDHHITAVVTHFIFNIISIHVGFD